MASRRPILPGLYLGGRDEARDLAWLQAAGISTVINMTPSRTDDPAGGIPSYHEGTPGLTYARHALHDNASTPFMPVLLAALSTLERARYHGGVLVHCAHGVSRSASVVIAFLVRTHGLSVEEALAYTRAARPIVRPNRAFLAQLQEFAVQVQRDRASGALMPPEPLPGGGTAARGGGEEEGGGAHGGGGGGPGASAGPLPLGSAGASAGAMAPLASSSVEQRKRQRPTGDEGAPAVAAPALCEECSAAVATVLCTACRVSYCSSCDVSTHAEPAIGEHDGLRQALPVMGGKAGEAA